MSKWVLAACDSSCVPPTGSRCTGPSEPHTKPFNSEHRGLELVLQLREFEGNNCKIWHQNLLMPGANGSDLLLPIAHTHTYILLSAPRSMRLWHRWEHQPKGLRDERRVTRHYLAPAAVEMQVATAPIVSYNNKPASAWNSQSGNPWWESTGLANTDSKMVTTAPKVIFKHIMMQLLNGESSCCQQARYL